MGIDYDSKLIVGWQVDREKVCKFLKEHNVGNCYGDDEQCFCGPQYCWKQWDACPVPKEFTFVECSPYFDCPLQERNVFLTLAIKEPMPITKLTEPITEPIDWPAAKQLAQKLGAEDEEAAVFSAPHIW